MKNFEQIRAANAFAAATKKEKYNFAGVNDGATVAKRVPTQIRENGFLGAMAFAIETKKGYETVFEAILAHLPTVKCDFGLPCNSGIQIFFNALAQEDADVLRAVTAESLAYLNYLRRFAKGNAKEGNSVNN